MWRKKAKQEEDSIMNKKHFHSTVILFSFLAAGIQPTTAINIPTDTSVGTWDSVTRVYTLNRDVSECIYVGEDDLTLDGNGHAVTGPGEDSGVTARSRTGVTIKNLNISHFSPAGIFLDECCNTTVTGNSTLDNVNGIYLFGGSNNTITNNICSFTWSGIVVIWSHGNILTGNTCDSNGFCGIDVNGSSNNTLAGNTVSNSDDTGIRLQESSNNNILAGNTASGNGGGIVLIISCDDNTITANTCNFNSSYGIWASGSRNILSHNTTSDNGYYGITIRLSNSTLTRSNTVSNNNLGIWVSGGSNNTLAGNTVSNSLDTGVLLNDSSNSQVYNNNFIGNAIQAEVSAGSDNVFNLAKPTGGNYWSNWTTPDDDHDGYVDNPYVFQGGQDNLPWSDPDGWLTPPTPEELIQQLISLAEALNLNQGINNSLDSKLQNALAALEAANAGQRQDAVNKMQAFINGIEAQRGNKIPEADADSLIAAAQQIIDLLMTE